MPLSDDVAGALLEAVVEDEVNLPDTFELAFRDPMRSVLSAGRFEIGASLKIDVGSEATFAGTTIFDGEITAVEAEIERDRTRDDRARLRQDAPPAARDDDRDPPRRHVRRHRRQGRRPPRPAARATAAPARSSTSRSCSGTPPTGSSCRCSPPSPATRSSSSTARCTSASPVTPAAAPGEGDLGTDAARQLVFGANLLRLRATVSGAEQVEEVKVRGWDYKTKEAVEGSARATGEARGAAAGQTAADLAEQARRRHARQGRPARHERRGRPGGRRVARRAARQRGDRARGRRVREPRPARRRRRQRRRRRRTVRRALRADVVPPHLRPDERVPDRVPRQRPPEPHDARARPRRLGGAGGTATRARPASCRRSSATSTTPTSSAA